MKLAILAITLGLAATCVAVPAAMAQGDWNTGTGSAVAYRDPDPPAAPVQSSGWSVLLPFQVLAPAHWKPTGVRLPAWLDWLAPQAVVTPRIRWVAHKRES